MSVQTVHAALRERFVGDIDEEFWVPAYQRGYRWGAHEVETLLDDIWESSGAAYYLQPVVVKEMTDGRWELIDGQQRLTTLYLILAFMKQESLQSTSASFTLDYETRPEMKGYLANPDDLAGEDNIDEFHLAAAYDAIANWFNRHGGRRQYAANKLYEYFFESVLIIWYEAPEDTDSATVFTRLNVGRIPLTDAELVKALLLSRAQDVSPSRGRAFEIATEWDAIERNLRNQELWAFLTGGTRQDSTHISLLLDVLAGGPFGDKRRLFQTFETLRGRIDESPLDVWTEVLDLHSLITGWFEDRDVFHRVGFLIATGDDFTTLVDLSRGKTKSAYKELLIKRIRTQLNVSADGLPELSYRNSRSEQVLLLVNVETVRRRSASSDRYSFHAHATGRWSLEHIHAQNAEPLTRQEQWVEWLRLHRDAIAGVSSIEPSHREHLWLEIENALALPRITEGTFRQIEGEVIKALGDSSDIDAHSITNLALLDAGANSALSNSVFEVKRREILKRDRDGGHIPASTRNVFLKYYTPGAGQQLHFWGPADRQGYLDAILDALSPYLTKTDGIVEDEN